jgi:ubiquinone/menaquinone biosynthesis C-methylase UbiE
MLCPKTIDEMNYSQLVGIVRERNRPSGGLRTINEVCTFAKVGCNTKVLEIGCNTGFTAVNMALLTKCKITGIDLNSESVEEARRYAKKQGVSPHTTFQVGDATALQYNDESFDLVWCSNVTSFISDKGSAIAEYLRVLRRHGTLAAIPIYYRTQPPRHIVKKISLSIGTKIEIMKKDSWIEMFETKANQNNSALELYYHADYGFRDIGERIDSWINHVLDKPHLKNYSDEILNAIRKRLFFFISLFNENLKHCGFSILLFQLRNFADEMELFHADKI